MAHTTLQLSADPKLALAELQASSREAPVLVFKRSPICPTSHWAEAQFREWLAARSSEDPLQVAIINVISERALARGLTSALGIDHESPQALLFEGGELRWHASHRDLTRDAFATHAGGLGREHGV